MKINIAATHRFHLLDLARELEKQGNDVHFYSFVPVRRCEEYGFTPSKSHSFLWLALPFLFLEKVFPKKLNYTLIWYRNRLMDWLLSKFMRKCDVFISLGSVYYKSILTAKEQGSITILEWGSKHIIDQLRNLNKLDTYPQRQLDLDLNSYKIVDYISIAATHVKESFVKHGVSPSKLLVNPYGVSLSQFRPTECTKEYDLIAVGGWRLEKGGDLLVEVCRKYGYKLLHVGAIVNLPFPNENNFTHQDPVDQKNLVDYYTKAKVFVLPSRAEGLSLVQAQAIICGLPIVCSKETGGCDLRNLLSDKEWIVEMQNLDIASLHDCIEKALNLADTQTGLRNYAGEDIKQLSWKAYGERYNQFINKIRCKSETY